MKLATISNAFQFEECKGDIPNNDEQVVYCLDWKKLRGVCKKHACQIWWIRFPSRRLIGDVCHIMKEQHENKPK